MDQLGSLMDLELARRLLIAFGIMLGAYLLRWILDKAVFDRMEKLAGRTRIRYDDLLVKALRLPISAIVFSTGIYFALLSLQLPEEPWDLPSILQEAWSITLLGFAVWIFYRMIDMLVAIVEDLLAKEDEQTRKQFTPIIRGALRFVLFALAGILIVQNLGYQVTSLITGMGIGGLAVALAAQDTLANIFGTVVMLTDRPFLVGDWVQVDSYEGTVEEIGFRSTRIRTWAKSLIVVPNKLLTERHLENWSAMPKRRIKMTLSLTYGTTPEQMETFVNEIRNLLQNDPAVDKDVQMIYFTDFGAHSLDVMIYYFTVTTIWAEYLAERQRINLEFMRIARRVGVEFAFPTQTLHFGEPLNVHQDAGTRPA